MLFRIFVSLSDYLLKKYQMAKDSDGKKYNRIPGYTRKVGGKTVSVRPHVRSNRTDSKGDK